MKMLSVSLLVCAMMGLATAGINAVIVSMLVEQGPCPEDFSHFNGTCYRFVPDPLSWAEAEENCLNMSANLASVHSLDEDAFIYEMIKHVDPTNPETWIGGSDCQQENLWLWSNGKPFVHTRWSTSEAPGYKHGCIVVNSGAKTFWDDKECSQLHPSVCALDV